MLDQLDDQDVLCEQCLLGSKEKLLCSGLRPVFSADDSTFYKALRVVQEPCDKFQALMEDNVLEARLRATMIPPKAIAAARKSGDTTRISVELTEFGDLIVDGAPTPTVSYEYSNLAFTQRMFRIGVALVLAGRSVKFLYPQWWYGQVRSWDDFGFTDLHTADWVLVERLDARGGTDFARSEMFAGVQQRCASGLPTVITISEDPYSRHPGEKAFLEEVQTWQKMN